MSSGSLRLDQVVIGLQGRNLIGPLTQTIRPGEAVTLMGPSGCGKSSLLAFICGTLDPVFTTAGRVWLGDEDITVLPPEQRRVGILFQDDLLFPHMTVSENLAFGLQADGAGRRQRRKKIDDALAGAGLDGFGDRDPRTLSGGQRARVALLRTLLASPRALLLDEPFGRLDAKLRAQFRRTVFEHARNRSLPVLLVTHDPDDAAAAAGPIIQLDTFDGPGSDQEQPDSDSVVVAFRSRS